MDSGGMAMTPDIREENSLREEKRLRERKVSEETCGIA